MTDKVKKINKSQKNQTLTTKQLERLLKKREEEKAKENSQIIGGVFMFIIIVALLIGAGFGIYYGISHLYNGREEKRLTEAYKACYRLDDLDTLHCRDIKEQLKERWKDLRVTEREKKFSDLEREAGNKW